MTSAENGSFRVGQPGVPLPAEFRQMISSGMQNMSSDAKAQRADRIRQSILALSPEEQLARVVPMRNLSQEKDRARHEKSAQTRTGKRQPMEAVIGQSTVWVKVKPLFLRDASVPEASDITGFQRRQVKDALHRNKTRPEWQRIDRVVDPELTRKRRSQAQKRRFISDPEIIENQKKGIELIRLFMDQNLVTEDLSSWKDLNDIYTKMNRDLPESLVDRIRLEFFLAARKALADGNPDLLIKYKELGDFVNLAWLGDISVEENFITQFVSGKIETQTVSGSDCVHHWMVEQSRGGKAEGACKNCGVHKVFSGARGTGGGVDAGQFFGAIKYARKLA